MTYPPQGPGQFPGGGYPGPPQPGPYQQWGQPPGHGYQPPPAPNRTPLIVGIVVALVLVLGGIIAVVVILNSKDDDSSSASATTTRSSPSTTKSGTNADRSPKMLKPLPMLIARAAQADVETAIRDFFDVWASDGVKAAVKLECSDVRAADEKDLATKTADEIADLDKVRLSDVENIVVSGKTATADITLTSGSKSKTDQVEVKKESGEWKLCKFGMGS